MMLHAILLSVCSGVASWECPISSNAMQMGHAIWALSKSAPSSALVALVVTCYMIWYRMWMGPLLGGMGSLAMGVVCGCELRK